MHSSYTFKPKILIVKKKKLICMLSTNWYTLKQSSKLEKRSHFITTFIQREVKLEC